MTLRKCVVTPQGPTYVDMTPEEEAEFEAQRAPLPEQPRQKTQIELLEDRVAALEAKVNSAPA